MEEVNGRNITYKRDIRMLLLRKPRMGDVDPTIPQRAAVIGTQTHADTNTPMQVGEHIIIKDGPLATTWYCAEISRIERQWIEVNYDYTTVTPALGNYDVAGKQRRISRLKEATFLRTWVLRNSGGFPANNHGPKERSRRVERLWRGRIPIEHIDDHLIIRDIGLNARGKLDCITRGIASELDIPHHCGA